MSYFLYLNIDLQRLCLLATIAALIHYLGILHYTSETIKLAIPIPCIDY